MKKTKILIPAIALAIIATGAVFWSTSVIRAKAASNGQTMVQGLAEKLGIDQEKVSGAMDEIRTERQAAMQEKMKTKLDEAVKAGTITETQKEAILNKQTEMQAKREQERKENEQWLSDNGLDQSTLRDLGLGMGRGMGGGMKGHSF